MQTATSSCHNQPNTRMAAFDLARGLAILFMVCIHILDFYGQPQIQTSLIGYAIEFLGRAPAAPVFMFIMGIFLAISSNTSIKKGLQRALGLIALGYLLNLTRGTLPMWLSLELGWVTQEILGSITPITEFWIVDILQFAGLAFALCILLKHFFPNPLYWAVATMAVITASPLLWDTVTGWPLIDGVLKLFWGGKQQGAMFPLFPWLTYPLAGMIFGYWLRQSQNISSIHTISAKIGFVLLAIGTILCLKNWEYHVGHYTQSGPGSLIWNLGFILVWLWICHYIIQKVARNRVFSVLFFWSQNVTAFYVIQWLMIGWGLMLVGTQQLNTLNTLIAILLVTLFSHYLVKVWLNIKNQLSAQLCKSTRSSITS